MAHSPGPWFSFKKNGTARLQVGSDRYDIAEMRHAGGESAEQANARLIAAAPELLAACQRVLDYWNGKGRYIDGVDVDDVVKAAVAKAEGRAK